MSVEFLPERLDTETGEWTAFLCEKWTRDAARREVMGEEQLAWTDYSVRKRWMVNKSEDAFDEYPYFQCGENHPGALGPYWVVTPS